MPGYPTEWTKVLPTPPGYTAGYVLLDARPDRPLRVWAEHLEFRTDPEESSAWRIASQGDTFSPV
jgi:hypothetical protein